jgi:tRNA (guanine26-N2/guanine27-N2)-dimethyltransferase
MRTVTEGQATITIPDEEKISKDLDIFYNPVMRTNRDLSVLLLLARGKEGLRVCDPLAGSGIRSLRFLKELPDVMIERIIVIDVKKSFPATFKENAQRSGTVLDRATVTCQEASRVLLDGKVQDYIDIDPFGSPNEFLDAATKRSKRGGVLAVTATDTAPLCGTYPRACRRKYWATPRRDHLMHEYGLRILIRKCQLVAAQYDRALTPVFSYSKDHYFRVFFDVQEGKAKVD